jgi:general secretion pathway protein G
LKIMKSIEVQNRGVRRGAGRRRSGFTLIEILLVAGILALLAAFAVPRLFNQAEQARIDLVRAQIGRSGPLGKALEAYKWDLGAYPDTGEGLAALYADRKDRNDENYKGPYMEGKLTDLKDSWGEPYMYRSPGDVNEDGYDLWSKGPDRKDDGGKAGSDDIKNWNET